MSDQCDIEPLGGHEYLVRVHHPAEIVESRFQATERVMADLHAGAGDERRVIEATMDFLRDKKSADELPQLVDLDDVAASYDDYVDALRGRLPSA
ncbi:hypothetical protein K7472_26165 [Streptomyces sp. PTM05]|uniref:Uncharacterized protein n=1 Tax=Streptantibioticus parmotrematis TaxID=2873249 RepID=A0ABS7QYK5_9ACTN|nr:hypothetical protein [Streptantibioticus parmotrematis]MBY8888297.1 hypothetical protein [Streptantibioticus parmotrematis]